MTWQRHALTATTTRGGEPERQDALLACREASSQAPARRARYIEAQGRQGDPEAELARRQTPLDYRQCEDIALGNIESPSRHCIQSFKNRRKARASMPKMDIEKYLPLPYDARARKRNEWRGALAGRTKASANVAFSFAASRLGFQSTRMWLYRTHFPEMHPRLIDIT